jgi:hypothetical protein
VSATPVAGGERFRGRSTGIGVLGPVDLLQVGRNRLAILARCAGTVAEGRASPQYNASELRIK